MKKSFFFKALIMLNFLGLFLNSAIAQKTQKPPKELSIQPLTKFEIAAIRNQEEPALINKQLNQLNFKKSKITSEHIIKIDYLCQSKRIEETYRGKDIYDESKKGEWVYFDCYFNELTIREKFNLPATVKYYEYDGKSAGQESGFIDELTNDAVLGNHPFYAQKRNRKKIE